MSEKKNVKKLDPFDQYDIREREAWLEDMAGQGLYLRSFGVFLVSFERGEPKKLRYRMEPAGRSEAVPEPAQNELYHDSGWEYVTTTRNGDFHVYCSEGLFAPETHTDPEVERLAFSRLKRNTFLSLVLCAIPIALIIGVAMTVARSGEPFIRILITGSVKALLPVLLVPAVGVYSAVSCRKMLRFNKAGHSSERLGQEGYRKKAVSALAAKLVLFVLWLALIITNLANMFSPSHGMMPDNYDKEFRFPLLQELEEKAEYAGYMSFDADFLAPEILTLSQYGGTETSLYVRYFQLRWEWAAKTVYSELEAPYLAESDNERTELDPDAVLYKFGAYQTLLIRRGDRVLCFVYEGDRDIAELMPMFEEALST